MKQMTKIFFVLSMLFIVTPKIYAQVGIGVGVSVKVAPPELPVYEQPECPGDGYIWTPGYWAYGDDDYYWVPGEWVLAPQTGYLWTPSYWDYDGGLYVYRAGYWGPHIGFYGGINYGYGYGGHGYYGGRWEGGHFRYNTAITRVNVNIVHNTYIDRSQVIVRNNNRVSFHGRGGINESPRAEERQAMNERHIQATAHQAAQRREAAQNRNQYAAVNHGKPAVAAGNANRAQANRPANNARNAAPVTRRAPQPQHVQPQREQPQTRRVQPQRVQPQRERPQTQRVQPQRVQPQRERAQTQRVQPQHVQPQRMQPQTRRAQPPRQQPAPRREPNRPRNNR